MSSRDDLYDGSLIAKSELLTGVCVKLILAEATCLTVARPGFRSHSHSDRRRNLNTKFGYRTLHYCIGSAVAPALGPQIIMQEELKIHTEAERARSSTVGWTLSVMTSPLEQFFCASG